MSRNPIHRVLIVRLATVALCTAAVLMATVLWVEFRSIDVGVADQATVSAERLRWAIMSELDKPGLGDHERIRRTLESAFSSKARLSRGSFVFVRILDPVFREVARARDPAYAHVSAVIGSLPKDRGAWNRVIRMKGEVIIHLGNGLKNSAGERVGYAEAVYVISPVFLEKARLSAVLTALISAGIVLLTTAILYPAINRLLRRVSGLSTELLHANLEILNVLGSAIAKRDSDTDIHNCRVTIYAIRIAQEMGLADDEIRSLIKGALLHDVGKIGIRDSILLKQGSLTPGEFEEMKQHVRHGLDIVGRSAWLGDAAPVVGGHHEWYDGTGYLEGRRGSDIPRTARIFALADVFDALTSRRPYKEAMGYKESMEIITEGRGVHFDPDILDALVRIAPSLYGAYANRDDRKPRDDLRQLGVRYFTLDLAVKGAEMKKVFAVLLGIMFFAG